MLVFGGALIWWAVGGRLGEATSTLRLRDSLWLSWTIFLIRAHQTGFTPADRDVVLGMALFSVLKRSNLVLLGWIVTVRGTLYAGRW